MVLNWKMAAKFFSSLYTYLEGEYGGGGCACKVLTGNPGITIGSWAGCCWFCTSWLGELGWEAFSESSLKLKTQKITVVVEEDSKKTKLTNTFDDEGKPFWHQMQVVDCVDLPSSWNGQASYNLKEGRGEGYLHALFYYLTVHSKRKKIAVRFGKFLAPFKRCCHNFYFDQQRSLLWIFPAKKVVRPESPEWNFEGRATVS